MSGVNRDLLLKIILLRRIRRRLKRQPRTEYIRSIFENRAVQGESHLANELRSDPEYRRRYFRMNVESYDEIYNHIESGIKSCNNHRRPITAHEKLAITLRYLGTGSSQIALSFA
ncbi:hypothetical protein Fcan01_08683 [Folsomia candida]|uniref:Uncharacterized protein n=1 Tax=Folsomia candida TaxID=158441 RepID=A0A226ECD5_FOLCA|nr:hypothetical protein Fcan01_08683 [Folsomia candida]